jgi:LPXTG-site transpeptidase (sortase) family protein
VSYQLSKVKGSVFRRLNKKLLVIFGIALVMYGGYEVWQRYETLNQPAELPNPNMVVTESTKNPVESKPKDNAEYTVASDQPRQIILNSLNVSGFIQKVGIDKENKIAVPSNIHFAGWYVNSVLPGDDGLSLIDGHVNGKYSDGIFKKLGDLKKGDVFQVEFGNNSIKNFEVIENKQVPESEAGKYFFTKNSDIQKQLNLITCGGKFDKNTQQYKDRIIVISKLQE